MKKNKLSKLFIATPGEKHKIKSFNSNNTYGLTQAEGESLMQENTLKMRKLQNKLYAYDRYALLIVFQAMDAAGKDSTIKHVMSGVNPQGCQVFSFKQPSSEELDHDYMWRIMKCAPERGRIGIFNRSHYEDVLVAKVHPEIVLKHNLPDIHHVKDITESFWKKRYRQINDIEKYWYENGIVMLKFFLNVSKEEQKSRFLNRLEEKSKNWKFSLSDLEERKYWDSYMKAYCDALTETSTEYAPWHVIPADNKWFMRYVVGKIITEKMEELNLRYPRITTAEQENLQAAREVLQNEEN